MVCDVCQAPARELNAVTLPGRWRALLICDACHKAHKAGQLLRAMQRAEQRQQLPPHLQRGNGRLSPQHTAQHTEQAIRITRLIG